MRSPNPTGITVPLKMVGGSNFGRYPMISIEETWNMIISDGELVPYAGYKIVSNISANGEGRGIYASPKLKQMLVAVDNGIYLLNSIFSPSLIGRLTTSTGTVYFAENNADEIGICDGENIYIFNYSNDTFIVADIDFIPAYISFQDTYFLAAVQEEAAWRLSANNDGTSWPDDANHVGTFETKANECIAVIPVPGQGGLLYVFGQTVIEPWYDTAAQLFPYQRSNYSNIDYGCLSAPTIATLQDLTVWLAANEKTGPVIMFSRGGDPQKISTDGIDFKLAQLTKPEDSYGFLFRQDGHMIYQITFVTDNISLAYDFNTSKFLNTCDQNMNFHIAKRVIYFNNTYYFVSFVDGNVYELNSKYLDFNGEEIPRIRITPTLRLPNSDQFITNNISFPVEQGIAKTIQRIDLSISIDGGYKFSSYDAMQLQPLGTRLNKFVYWNLGWSNEICFQFRFWGRERFLVTDGEVNIFQ